MNKYFKLPLKLWDACDIKVFDADDNMAFDFAINFDKDKPTVKITESDKKKIINLINGEELPTKQQPLSYKDGTIYYNDIEFIWIRSWGRLTGLLGLSAEKARQAQDEFAEYIINKLTLDV